MRWLLGFFLLVVLPVTILFLAPARIDPVAWSPDPDPGLTGPFAPNDKLANVERVLEGAVSGPEDVACGPGGVVYAGLKDGRIVRVDIDGSHGEFANTGGRPLGMELDLRQGRLIVADARRGLLAISAGGAVEVLTDSVDGDRILFADDLDIAGDGTIWFSDASARFGYGEELYDFLEGRGSGRLLRYDPQTGTTTVHMSGLMFANGVALGPEEAYVLVSETGTGRIHRLWLKGEKTGQRDLFKVSLPGTPDNISFNGRDTFWVALPGPRTTLDANAGRPWLRKLVSRLPINMLEDIAPPSSFVVGLDLQGEVSENLQSADGAISNITSATECQGHLYIGSLSESSLARYPLQ